MKSSPGIAQIFENIAVSYSNQIALYFKDREISYNELNQCSNKIAHYLISQGLHGSNIGILLNRSPEIVIAILGILKAGCAYIFLDPKNPPERLQYILENADVKFLITEKAVKAAVNGVLVSQVKIDKILSGNFHSENPGFDMDTDKSAYIMYTSGSTGKPKGVEISHANVINYIHAIKSLFDIKPDDVYLHTASFSFSSSIRQYLVSLLSGNSVYIAGDEEIMSLRKLLDIIKKGNVTIFDSTPMLWKYGLNQIERLNFSKRNQLLTSKLRLLVFSGDMLPAQLITKIRTVYSKPLKIINVCGQTESIGGMAFPIPEDFDRHSGTVPIGYPLINTRINVFDENLSQVKDGDIGELYISSPSVALGYYKNPELTQKVFIENQFPEDTTLRTLKTGDLVRFWKNMPLEIIGRSDFQVKIRGVRIDLNEIERNVLQFPSVNECIVIGTVNQDDESILVCFVVEKKNTTINTNQLKNHLGKVLLDTYIPDRIICLEKLPLTPNGKVDRRILQEIANDNPHEAKSDSDITFKNEIQKNLYYIFAKVLNSKNITFQDSFFDMGGHSLKAVELIEIMENVFNKKIPLEFIYKYASIDELTPAIEGIDNEIEAVNLIGLHPQGVTPPFFCVHGDDGNYFLSKYLGDEIPFYGYFHQGRNGDHIKFKDILTIADKYVEELLQARPTGPYILGGYSIGGVIAYEMVNVLMKKGKEVSLLILIDSESPDFHGVIIPGRHFFNKDKVLYFMDDDQRLDSLSLLNKVKSAFHNRFNRYGYQVSHLFLFFGAKVPIYFRNSYIMGVYRRARKRYSPDCLDVNTILVRSTIDNYDDYKLGWDRYIRGSLDIYEMDSEHSTIIKEPQVRILADLIRKVIINA